MDASKPQTRPILLDVNVWFILRAAMSLRFRLRVVIVVAIFVCAAAGTSLGQKLPKTTGSEPENRPGSGRRPKTHQPAPPPTKPAASIESGNFLELGDKFRAQKKWKAAEAAYKEAVTSWPHNADALMKLGSLYLDRNRVADAERTYNQLRSVDAAAAANLLAAITSHKNALAH